MCVGKQNLFDFCFYNYTLKSLPLYYFPPLSSCLSFMAHGILRPTFSRDAVLMCGMDTLVNMKAASCPAGNFIDAHLIQIHDSKWLQVIYSVSCTNYYQRQKWINDQSTLSLSFESVNPVRIKERYPVVTFLALRSRHQARSSPTGMRRYVFTLKQHSCTIHGNDNEGSAALCWNCLEKFAFHLKASTPGTNTLRY